MKFLVLHDYGQGGSAIIVYAQSLDQVKSQYPHDRVIDTDIEDHPVVKFLGDRIHVLDIRNIDTL